MIRLNKYEAKQTSDLRITLLNAIEIGDDCHANVLPPLLEIKQGSNVCVCVCVCDYRFAEYDTSSCKQKPAVAYTLKLLIGVAPVAFIITGLIILIFYPISEEVRLRNRTSLEELR